MTSDRNSTAAPTKDPKTGKWRFVLDLGPGPDANGVWRQRRQAKRRGFPTKAAAMSAMTTLRTEGENGTYAVPRAETVATWMAVWFETLDAYVKPSTADCYRRVGKRHVVPKLGPIPLQMLDAQHLNAVYAEMLRSGRKNGKGGLSFATVRHVHVIIGKALDAALRAGPWYSADLHDRRAGPSDRPRLRSLIDVRHRGSAQRVIAAGR